MHHELLIASSEEGPTKRTKRKCNAHHVTAWKNIEKPWAAPKKWLVCKRGKPSSCWGIRNELYYVHISSFIAFMSWSNVASPIEWGLQSTYWHSQMTGLKVKVCKPQRRVLKCALDVSRYLPLCWMIIEAVLGTPWQAISRIVDHCRV